MDLPSVIELAPCKYKRVYFFFGVQKKLITNLQTIYNTNPKNPVVKLRFVILSSDSADRGRSIIRVTRLLIIFKRNYSVILITLNFILFNHFQSKCALAGHRPLMTSVYE
jgi:hypothetical protein